MVHLNTLALAISVAWTRASRSSLVWLWCCCGALWAPQPGWAQKAPEGKQLQEYNELFFRAEQNRLLENNEQARAQYEQLLKIYPGSDLAHYQLGRLDLEEENWAAAQYHLEQAHRLDTSNIYYLEHLAKLYQAAPGSKAKEIGIWRKLTLKEPREEQYHLQLARAYLEQDSLEKALAQLQNLEDITGVHEKTIDLKKNILLQLGDVDRAAAEMYKLIKAYPRNINYLGTLAQIYRANGRSSEALPLYRQMLALDSSDARPHLDLANYYQEEGMVDSSLYHLHRALGNPRMEVRQKIQILVNLFQQGQRDEHLLKRSWLLLDTVQKIHPNTPEIWALTGDFYSNSGQDMQAIAAFKKTLHLAGGQEFKVWEQLLLLEIQNELYDSLIVDGPEAIAAFPNQPMPYLFTGAAHLALKQARQAVSYLELGLAVVISNPRLKEQFLTQLADAHHRLQEHQKSDQYFDQALEINPRNPTALNNYAYYLALRGEELDKALRMTQKSNELSPQNPVFLDTYAWVLYRREEHAKALEIMEQVLALSRQASPEILEHYGDILLANKKREEARQAYEKALKLNADSASLQSKLQSLP